MAKIIKDDGMGWFAITTPQNFTSYVKFNNWRKNNWPKRQLIRSLIAQHYNVESAKILVDKLQKSDQLLLISWKKVLITSSGRYGQLID